MYNPPRLFIVGSPSPDLLALPVASPHIVPMPDPTERLRIALQRDSAFGSAGRVSLRLSMKLLIGALLLIVTPPDVTAQGQAWFRPDTLSASALAERFTRQDDLTAGEKARVFTAVRYVMGSDDPRAGEIANRFVSNMQTTDDIDSFVGSLFMVVRFARSDQGREGPIRGVFQSYLNGPDSWKRYAVIDQLPHAPPSVQLASVPIMVRLIERESDLTKRMHIINALKGIGQPGIDALNEMLEDDALDRSTRGTISFLLGGWGLV